MQPTTRRVLERDRALARISRLTSLTALAGVVGTVGFGGLAALNYSGTSTAADTTQSTTAQPTDNTGSTTRAQHPGAQATTPPTTQIQPVNPPTRSTGRRHVSTGGSG